MKDKIMAHCIGCGTTIGNFHADGCDWERCPICGGQSIGCGHTDEEKVAAVRLTWTGYLPMVVEAEEYGFYHRRTHDHIHSPYVPCSADDPEAEPDVVRVILACEWDPKSRKFILRKGS